MLFFKLCKKKTATGQFFYVSDMISKIARPIIYFYYMFTVQ